MKFGCSAPMFCRRRNDIEIWLRSTEFPLRRQPREIFLRAYRKYKIPHETPISSLRFSTPFPPRLTFRAGYTSDLRFCVRLLPMKLANPISRITTRVVGIPESPGTAGGPVEFDLTLAFVAWFPSALRGNL